MRKTLILSFIALLLAACGGSQAAPAAPTLTQPTEPAATTTNSPFRVLTLFPTLTPWPTLTPTLLLTPTFTPTPVPTLVAHEFSQSEPLVVMELHGGDSPCAPISTGLGLILFPDGKLFVDRYMEDLHAFRIQTTRLSRQETCQLLNSIDQAGFFDYDPASYIFGESPGDGAPSIRISAQAWRSNSVDLYALREFLDHPNYFVPSALPTILPALRKTYRLLADYHPVNMEIVTSIAWEYGSLLVVKPRVGFHGPSHRSTWQKRQLTGTRRGMASS